MGVAAAAGSFGQFLMVPVESWLIGGFGWQNALFVLGCLSLLIMPLAFGLREPRRRRRTPGREQSIVQALREAFRYPSFRWLMAGYFVCGFQVVFIGVHMPSYLKDKGLSPEVASYALALIGLFNVFGTYAAGIARPAAAEAPHPVDHLPAALGRDRRLPARAAHAVERLHLLVRDGPAVAVDRAADQCGGGADLRRAVPVDARRLRLPQPPDRLLPRRLARRRAVRPTGSYDIVWCIAIALGVFAALVNLPVREAPIVRLAPAAA